MPIGNIRCAKCHKAITKKVCSCGYAYCYISVYWKGKQWRFFRATADNEFLDYKRATSQLTEINFTIEHKKFNPIDWTAQAVKERKFTVQIERWLNRKREERDNGERANETIRTYRSYIENHFKVFFEKWDVQEIRYEQIEDFKDWLGKRVSINTRKRMLGALHAFFRWMWRRGVIKEFPVWPVIEGEETVKRALDSERQFELLKAIDEKHRDIFEFGVEVGLRPNELCAIQVQDIDMINRRALIQRGYSGVKLQDTTKGKNKKWIPLSDRAFEIAQKNTRSKLPTVFLFINPTTRRGYTLKTLDNVWRKYTGGEITKNEFMRHSFCTQIAESGANLLQAKELMRHKDIRSTEHYFHATTDRLREIVNRRSKIARIERTLNENSQ